MADEPLAVRLMVKDAYGSMPLMLENGSISVEGKVTSENLNGTVNYNFLTGFSDGISFDGQICKIIEHT